jgi:endonuclease/exonuclease/phosphatase family metal-dependent hydrolase
MVVDSTVRTMTWNIWWRFGPRWRDRQPAISETIKRFSPDIVALQEVWSTDETTQADELAKALGMYAVFASPSYPPAPMGTGEPEWEGVDLGIAVLSRWPVLDDDTAVMPARHRA